LKEKAQPSSLNLQPVIKLHEPSYNDDEIEAVVAVLKSTNVTSGEKVREMEALFGKNAVMCNSGSSANLLAIATLCNPLTPDRLERGDEVIVSALSWSTTVWPLVQHGLIPVIVDIDPQTLNLDLDQVLQAISPKTRAVMPVHVYGNPCHEIVGLCEDNDLVLIQDCCEAFATGGQGLMSTYSFYFSHHITTLEGGMVVCRDEQHAEIMRCIRAHGWTRDMKNPITHPTIDPRFLFVTDGYNLRASEVNAAMGVVQMGKVDGFIAQRKKIANLLKVVFEPYVECARTQKDEGSTWFGFPVVGEKVHTEKFRQHLENNGVETRSLICGNIARQPAMELYEHRVHGDLIHADHVMEHGFSLPCHQSMNETDVEYIQTVVDEYFMDHL